MGRIRVPVLRGCGCNEQSEQCHEVGINAEKKKTGLVGPAFPAPRWVRLHSTRRGWPQNVSMQASHNLNANQTTIRHGEVCNCTSSRKSKQTARPTHS
jgi:hypothetical protein